MGRCSTAQKAQISALWWPRGAGGGRVFQEGGGIHTHRAGSLCCTVETNPTSQSNYMSIFKNMQIIQSLRPSDILPRLFY